MRLHFFEPDAKEPVTVLSRFRILVTFVLSLITNCIASLGS